MCNGHLQLLELVRNLQYIAVKIVKKNGRVKKDPAIKSFIKKYYLL